MSQCPFIQDPAKLTESEFNVRAEYDGYTYWIHDDGYGNKTNVQHCKLIGRKRDIFECLNEGEWQACPHYRMRIQITTDAKTSG